MTYLENQRNQLWSSGTGKRSIKIENQIETFFDQLRKEKSSAPDLFHFGQPDPYQNETDQEHWRKENKNFQDSPGYAIMYPGRSADSIFYQLKKAVG